MYEKYHANGSNIVNLPIFQKNCQLHLVLCQTHHKLVQPSKTTANQREKQTHCGTDIHGRYLDNQYDELIILLMFTI